jgi:hypothetical protein
MIKVAGKTYRKVRTTGRKLGRVSGAEVAQAVGAESTEVSPSSAQGPVALFGLRQALGARLKSTGGRPSLGVSRRQKIPLDDADWGLLCELAEELGDNESRPTPGQVASELLHQRLMEVRDKMGPRDAGPPRSPLRHKRTGTG